MPIDPDTAAAVARRHGLSLMDAAGLAALADDENDADRIAARFAGSTEPDPKDTERTFVRALFGKPEPVVVPAPEVTPPGVVATEGTNPSTTNQARQELRRFTARLFDTPDQDHI